MVEEQAIDEAESRLNYTEFVKQYSKAVTDLGMRETMTNYLINEGSERNMLWSLRNKVFLYTCFQLFFFLFFSLSFKIKQKAFSSENAFQFLLLREKLT